MAGHRAGDDRGVPLVDQQAEGAAGAEHSRERGQRGGRVVDDLQDAVAEHHVGPLLLTRLFTGVGQQVGQQVGQVLEAALATGDPVGDTALVGSTGQDREGVRAGVDDHHPVAELGDPDREPAGAAADVDD